MGSFRGYEVFWEHSGCLCLNSMSLDEMSTWPKYVRRYQMRTLKMLWFSAALSDNGPFR